MTIHDDQNSDNSNHSISIHRAPQDEDHPYVMIFRALFLDKSISIEAKGLAGYLASYTYGDYCPEKVASELSLDESYVDNLMQELQKAGYLVEVLSE